MSDQEISFKVTDRRLFNADGSPRDVPPEEKPEPKAASTVEESKAEPTTESRTESTEPRTTAAPESKAAEPPRASSEAEEDDDDLDAEDPASFANFMMSIASNAASSLGMMEHPVTHKREVDLELGKHWIDVLGMLEKKTQGNLSSQEKQILESLLSDLRMQYVSLTHSTAKAARPYTGKDILGG
jgi:hypothetical protein